MDFAFVARIVIAVVLLVQLPLVARRSMEYLREAPDFPHKPQMLRGAKWGGWLALVPAIPLTTAIWFPEKLLPRLGMVAGIGLLLLQALLLWAVGKYWPLIGFGASLKLWWEPVECDKEQWYERVQRLERWRGSLAYVVLICGLGAGAFAVVYAAYLLSELDRLVAMYL